MRTAQLNTRDLHHTVMRTERWGSSSWQIIAVALRQFTCWLCAVVLPSGSDMRPSEPPWVVMILYEQCKWTLGYTCTNTPGMLYVSIRQNGHVLCIHICVCTRMYSDINIYIYICMYKKRVEHEYSNLRARSAHSRVSKQVQTVEPE